jgi:hypothetical protein
MRQTGEVGKFGHPKLESWPSWSRQPARDSANDRPPSGGDEQIRTKFSSPPAGADPLGTKLIVGRPAGYLFLSSGSAKLSHERGPHRFTCYRAAEHRCVHRALAEREGDVAQCLAEEARHGGRPRAIVPGEG